jgi:hypothetical protein
MLAKPEIGKAIRGSRMFLCTSFGLLLFAFIFLGGATAARADDYGKCQDKLADARGRLNQDVARHGEYSNQAQHDRDRLGDAQNWCSRHHIFPERNDYRRDNRYFYGDRNYDSYR